MKTNSLLLFVIASPLTFLLCSCSSKFSYTIDPDISLPEQVISGEPGEPIRIFSVMVHPDGTREDYVDDEIILAPESDGELADFLKLYNGRVVNDGSFQSPPDSLDYENLRLPLESSGFYVIKVDLDTIDFESFHTNMTNAGLIGPFKFSTVNAARLAALVVKEQSQGKIISNNNLLTPSTDCVIDRTQEWQVNPLAPDSSLLNSGYYNAFRYDWFNDPEFGVTKAWQYMELIGLNKKTVAVAFVDYGFQVNEDFRGYPQMWGYDSVDGDYDVSENSPDGQVSFENHGSSVMNIAAALHNNRFGSAGTGGQVVVPLLFRSKIESHAANAIYNASVNWGAEVINISLNSYDSFIGITAKALNIANSHKVIVVNAAGNDEKDLDQTAHNFTDAGWVIGVGAIERASKKSTRKQTQQLSDGVAWGSNYGSGVDIWAPGNSIDVPALNDILPTPMSGTSASAPYVSGVVALMKAIKPDLKHDDVLKILQNTANKSSDPRVKTGYVNAYDAVVSTAQLAGLSPKGDSFESNDSFGDAFAVDINKSITATVTPGDWDFFKFQFSDYLSNSKVLLEHKKYFKNNPGEDLNLELYDHSYQAFAMGIKLSVTGYAKTTEALISGNLSAGKHYRAKVRGATPESMNCYRLSVFPGNPSTILPDRFDDGNFEDGSSGKPRNDEFTNRSIISDVTPANSVTAMHHIQQLNFDVVNDIDYFEIRLPASTDEATGQTECINPGTKPYGESGFSQGFLEIAAYPEQKGYAWPFDIRVYDSSKVEFKDFVSKSGMSLKIECPHKSFPDGVIRFSIGAKEGRRNFYQVALHYSRWDQMLDMPQWTKLLPYPPMFKFPPFPLTEKITLFYPTNPDVIDDFLRDGSQVSLPAEYAILSWPEPRDFEIDITTEHGSYLEIALYDAEQQELARTSTDRSKETDLGKATLRVDDLSEGIYVLAFGSADFATVYSIMLDTGNLAVH